MIKKIYRLKEKEVKRVLAKWKPFFSYNIVLNSCKNTCWYPRFAIVISKKSVNSNVERNFLRRFFYDKIFSLLIEGNNNSKDYVFVVKSKAKFDKNDRNSIMSFQKDIDFLLKKI